MLTELSRGSGSQVIELAAEDRRPALQEAAGFIRSRLQSDARGIVEIGRRLQEIRGLVDGRAFNRWACTEFSWSRGTASKYMCVARVFGEASALENIQSSALYLLARKAVSPIARQQALRMAAEGLPVSRQMAVTLIRQHSASDSAPRSSESRSALLRRALKLPPGEIVSLADDLLKYVVTMPVPPA